MISARTDYWKLLDADELALLYDQNKQYLSYILMLNKRIGHEEINQDDIIWILRHFKELRVLETKIPKGRAQLSNLEDPIETIRNELGFLASKKWRLEYEVDILTDQESKLIKKSESYRQFQALDRELEELS